jgi:guanylate kinase
MARRLDTARAELAAQDDFDEVVVNSDWNPPALNWYPCWWANRARHARSRPTAT